MSNVGWIKLHRKILNWEWYQDSNTCRVYIHLLLTALYEDRKWKGKDLKIGDCLFSGPQICKEIGLTKQELRTALKKLVSTRNITLTSTSKYFVANIVKYQSFVDVDVNNKKQSTPNQPHQQHQLQHISNPQMGAFKEINNLNNNIFKNTNSKELVQKERGSRLDINLKLSPQWKEFAIRRGLSNPEITFEQFKNYWTSPNAKMPFKKDWTATWRNWVLKEVNSNKSNRHIASAENLNPYEGMSATEIFMARGIL